MNHLYLTSFHHSYYTFIFLGHFRTTYQTIPKRIRDLFAVLLIHRNTGLSVNLKFYVLVFRCSTYGHLYVFSIYLCFPYFCSAVTLEFLFGDFISMQERERDHFSQFLTEGFTSYCKRKRRDKVCDYAFFL